MAIKNREIRRIAAVHPGRILKSELEAREITQTAFAGHIGVTPGYLSDIIKGRRGVSVPMAFKLCRALGIDVEVWCNLQLQYEIGSIDPADFQNIKAIAA